MDKQKQQLLYSKLVRGLQLLNVALEKGRVSEKEHAKLTQEYQNRLQKLTANEDFPKEHSAENYLKNKPLPKFLHKPEKEETKPKSYPLLGGIYLKIIIAIIAFLAISFFSPYVLKLQKHQPLFLIIAFGCPLLYLILAYSFDKYEPEPKLYVLGAFVWGAICTILALYLNKLTYAAGSMAISICLAGFTEELVKGIAIYRLSKHPEFNDAIDAIVYGFAVGLGFAAVENVFYYFNALSMYQRAEHLTGAASSLALAKVVSIRASLCALGHAVFTSVMALYLAKVKLKNGLPSFGDFVIAYLLAALLHGLFNAMALFLGDKSIYFNAILVTIALWVFYSFIRETWSNERTWGSHLTNTD